MSLAERAADLGYGPGGRWSVASPNPGSAPPSDAAGGRAGGNGGPEQLRRNLSRVLAVDPVDVPDDLMRASTRSYSRYWREAFRLPSMDFAQAASRVHVAAEDLANFEEAYSRGKGVVFALPHSGNWDMAGVWLVNRIGGFSTFAERVEARVAVRAVRHLPRESRFEIFPSAEGRHRRSDRSPSACAPDGWCVCAERDLAEHGVPVQFLGEPTRMPAGPAKLAIETGAALLPVHHWFTDTHGSQISCDPRWTCRAGVRGDPGHGRRLRPQHRGPPAGLAHAAAAVGGRLVAASPRELGVTDEDEAS